MRKALFIGSVFVALGACAAVACSGFSSSESSDPNDANVLDDSTVPDDSQSADDAISTGDSSFVDAAVADSALIDSGRLRVFVTSSVHQGNFQNGSAICASLAEDAGLGGDWFAWLSKAGVSANDSLHTSGPWWNVHGKLVAAVNDAGVVQAFAPISLTERGETTQGTTTLVWTGTYADGGRGPSNDHHCASWTEGADASRSGIVGDLTTLTWSDVGVLKACGYALHLYCFEIP